VLESSQLPLRQNKKTEHNGLRREPASIAVTIHPIEIEEKDMYFLGLGLILLAMKFLEIAPVAAWSWLVVLAPFGLAVAWWSWADASGYTKRKSMAAEEARKQARIDKGREAIGTLRSKKRR
jgi:small Trp-rich protein